MLRLRMETLPYPTTRWLAAIAEWPDQEGTPVLPSLLRALIPPVFTFLLRYRLRQSALTGRLLGGSHFSRILPMRAAALLINAPPSMVITSGIAAARARQ